MPTFTVIGATTLTTSATTDPQSWAIPLHGDTVVGDYMLLTLLGGDGVDQYSSVDARLTETFGAAGALAGGFGEVTDLSDVAFTSAAYSPGLAIVTVVRPAAGFGLYASDYYEGDPAVSQAGRATATDALLWVAASWGFDGTVTLVPAAGDVVADASMAGEKRLLSVSQWHGSPPAPVLDAAGIDLFVRQGWVVLGQTSARAWLRQRQSPRANVRVSLNRPQLRARQKFL